MKHVMQSLQVIVTGCTLLSLTLLCTADVSTGVSNWRTYLPQSEKELQSLLSQSPDYKKYAAGSPELVGTVEKMIMNCTQDSTLHARIDNAPTQAWGNTAAVQLIERAAFTDYSSAPVDFATDYTPLLYYVVMQSAGSEGQFGKWSARDSKSGVDARLLALFNVICTTYHNGHNLAAIYRDSVYKYDSAQKYQGDKAMYVSIVS